MFKRIYPAIAIFLGIIFGLFVRCSQSALSMAIRKNRYANRCARCDIGRQRWLQCGNRTIDENVEGLFLLDGLTGDLTCNIVSVFNGKFFARMHRNVLNDLNLDNDKNTRLLMVTGAWSFRNQSGQMRPSDSLIYVVDSSSGNYAAYAVPWNKLVSNKGRQGTHLGKIELLDKGTSRDSKAN